MGVDDTLTGVQNFIDYAHHEVHDGRHFYVTYSVPDIGAMTTPNDMITISWTTPNTERLMHLIWSAICADGARVRLIRGKTGGGATPTGTLQTYNSNESSSNTSGILDVAGDNASKVSYDATLFTGGVTLLDEYLGGSSVGSNLGVGTSRGDSELICARNTEYQLSIFLAAAKVATIKMDWYEHISKT